MIQATPQFGATRPALTVVPARPASPKFGCSGKDHSATEGVAKTVQDSSQAREKIVAEMDRLIDQSSGLKKLGLKMIRAYKNSTFIHEKLYKAINLKCLYAEQGMPSCSQFGFAAVEKKGFIVGSLMALGRMLNCNPVSGKLGLTKKLFTVIA